MVRQNVLLIGSGGREHALAWKLAQSPKLKRLFVAPGNAGTAQVAENIDIQATDIKNLHAFATKNQIGLTIVGPDAPLELGIVDEFQKSGLRIFGPTKKAAEIEWSKSFSKTFLKRYRIPTANFKVFSSQKSALNYLKTHGAPVVIKVSGLALGKGVFVCQTLEQARKALHQIFVKKLFGSAGRRVVVEDFLDGQEISIHVLSDGIKTSTFPAAQDHKSIFDNDEGPNTGGMGSFTPVPWVSGNLMNQVNKKIIESTLKNLVSERNFLGCLFPGLMITDQGPKVLEFNARLGDPETQSYMRLLKSDLLELLDACTNKNLKNTKLSWSTGYAICVVLASKGYPGDFEIGEQITGIKKAESVPGVVVFHSGTKSSQGKLLTSGGRVLSVTAVGKTLTEARNDVYKAIDFIRFRGMQYRTDIGAKSL